MNLRRPLQAWRIAGALKGGISRAQIKLHAVLSATKLVKVGPVGFSAATSFEYELLREFSRQFEDKAADFFRKSLRDSNPFFVGYCLVALQDFYGIDASEVRGAIENDEKTVKWMIGCLVFTDSLAAFAEAISPAGRSNRC